MINGMTMPAQVQVQGANTAAVTGTGQASSGKFGSILASLANGSNIEGQQATTDSTGIFGALNELLDLTTIEDVLAFLQENGFEEEMLPEVIDGHFVFAHESEAEGLLQMLRELIPNFDELESVTRTEDFVVSVQDLFTALEEVAEELLTDIEQGTLQENYTNEELVLLAAMMQMTSIEGPQTDLTLKQEHQLHALQEVLKTLGHTLNEGSNQSTKNPLMPFQVQNDSFKQSKMLAQNLEGGESKVTNPAVTQTSFSIPASMGMENAKLEGEVKGSSRTEALLKELQSIFKRANFGQTGGTSRISIKLYPEHLGQLRIELLQTNGLLTARILASNALGKEMLESQLHQLRQAFLQQNVQVERIDISEMLTETPDHEKNQAFNEQFKQKQEETHKGTGKKEDDDESMTFSEYMIELEG